MPHQRARIDSRDHRHRGRSQEFLRGLVGSPVARQWRKFPDHQSFDIRAHRLVVRLVGSIVAYLGIGQHHDLAGIGGIREDLLIAGYRRVEHHFARPLDRRTKTLTLEDRAVFQGEDC